MEYEIKGGPFPVVVCTLQKGETMKNETGAMSFMTSNMKMETTTGGGLLKGSGRALSGDTLFLNYFTAQSDNEKNRIFIMRSWKNPANKIKRNRNHRPEKCILGR